MKVSFWIPIASFLRCEILKLAHSRATLICLVLPLIVSGLVALNYLTRPEIDPNTLSWGRFFQTGRALWSLFALPPLLALVAALSLGLEHQNDNWQLILTQPVSRNIVFVGKFLPLIGLMGIAQLTLFGSTVVLGLALEIWGEIPWRELGISGAAIPAMLPVLAFQFWLSLAWRSFVLPVGAGFFGAFITIVSSQISVGSFRPATLLPWHFPFAALEISGGSVDDLVLHLAQGSVIALAFLWLAYLYYQSLDRDWRNRAFSEKRALLVRHTGFALALLLAMGLLVARRLETGGLIEWLQDNARAIALSQETDDDADLKPFGDAVGESRIVMLGEAGHGDGATFELKARLVRYLHQQKGFEVMVFESGLFSCLTAGEAILQGGGPRSWSRRALFPVWGESAQVEPLLDYIGRSSTERVPLILGGMDVQLSGSLAKDLLLPQMISFFRERNPTLITSPEWSAFSRNLELLFDHPQQWIELPDNEFQSLLDSTAALESGIVSPVETLPLSHQSQLFWERVLHNLQAFFRFMRALDPDDPSSIRVAGPIREEQMASNLLWLADVYYPGKKIIVWGATSHLSRNRQFIETAVDTQMVPVGHQAWEVWGDDLYSVAFGSFEGVRGLPGTGAEARPRDIGTAPSGSLEDLLVRAGFEVAFLNFRRSDLLDHFRSPFVSRALGHGPRRGRWDQAFDGFFFIRNMTPNTRADSLGVPAPRIER